MDTLKNTSSNLTAILDTCGRQQTTPLSNHHDSIWLTRISFPLFLIIGTIGNTAGIILVIKERSGGRQRGNKALDASRSRKTFLLALFASDLCYLWNRLILLLSAQTWDTNQSPAPFFIWTYGVWAFLDSLLSFSSQGILVVFCVDRFYALTSPLQHKSSISYRRRTSLIIVSMIYLGTAACSLILPVLYYWQLVNVQPGRPPPIYPASIFLWRILDAWFEFLIRSGSAIIIVVLNRRIFFKIRQPKLKLSVHLHQPRRKNLDPELTSIMTRGQVKTSKSAIKILFCSSVFYLSTNVLEIVLSFLSVLSIYPSCLFQLSAEIVNAFEPARDFLRHAYFTFGFLFYVCLKLKRRESFIHRRSFDDRSSDMGNHFH